MMNDNQWSVDQSSRLYQVEGWGSGYFRINDAGNVETVADGIHSIDLKQLCEQLADQGFYPPLLLRFSDILNSRMEQLYRRFSLACSEAGYEGRYYGVYPIKVNQQYQVVEEIIEFGSQYNWGLEAGSKPELHATLAMLEDVEGLIVCNGYKDREYIELAMLGLKMGKQVFIVIEKPHELDLVIDSAQRHGVTPLLGLRCKLATSSNGMWDDSGGDMSKFGLSASEVLDSVTRLQRVNMLEGLKLLHFHIGSQVPQIRNIKEAIQEAARFFVEMKKLGAPIEYMDVGGGLGVNYDGTISGNPSSVDYSLQEYANDIVWTMKEICDEEGVSHPNIISESGRALVAHHAILVVDVLAVNSLPVKSAAPSPGASSILQLQRLWQTLQDIESIAAREALHDAIALREDVYKLFSLGHASLQDRASADDIYWQIVSLVMQQIDKHELKKSFPKLSQQFSDRYFCNFSVFQSLPDSWAINQVFPVMPIQRLNERPDRNGFLVDITCDSDGKLQRFPLENGVSDTLPLHSVAEGENYLLGIFLTGAYQEILGDLHNLFGDTHAVHIRIDGDSYEIEQIVEGESVADVLDYVQFHETVLVDRMRRQIQQARVAKNLTAKEANAFLRFYQQGLKGYTYLEEDVPLP